VPELSGEGALEVSDLRAACVTALRRAGGGIDPVVILGDGAVDVGGRQADAGAQLAGYGGIRSASGSAAAAGFVPAALVPEALPLTIARWLLGQLDDPSGTVRVVDTAAGLKSLRAALTERRCVLLVMGDGSARRGDKAPGYLDVRAEPFDADVRAALASGQPGRLCALDVALGGQLLAAGAPAWRLAGAAIQAETNGPPRGLSDTVTWSAELHYAGDPFGVSYFVSSWLPPA
jgi:hypothetical protein